jgi:hypothetical protein
MQQKKICMQDTHILSFLDVSYKMHVQNRLVHGFGTDMQTDKEVYHRASVLISQATQCTAKISFKKKIGGAQNINTPNTTHLQK